MPCATAHPLLRYMSDRAVKILSDNMKRLIGPRGVYSSNAAASAASNGVTRSTYDRARNGYKIGAPAIAIDKLDGIAKAFGMEVWQLFVPDIDVNNPPRLVDDAEIGPGWPLKKSTPNRIRTLSAAQQRRADDALDAILKGLEAEGK